MGYDPFGSGALAIRSATGVEVTPEVTWSTQSVDIQAVQCFRCGNYRRVPEKRKYEEIREKILVKPWECKFASQWSSEDTSCDLPDEFTSPEYVLILDRPAIPASPPRWERQCILRKQCSTRFADIYYSPPNGGKRIKSKRDIMRYRDKFPECLPPDFDVPRQTCFRTPRPPPGL